MRKSDKTWFCLFILLCAVSTITVLKFIPMLVGMLLVAIVGLAFIIIPTYYYEGEIAEEGEG